MTDPEMLTGRSRPAIRIERRYDHPVERVWRAVTEPGSLVQWFPAEAEFDLEPGGEARFGEGDVGRVLEVDPSRHLAFTWQDDRFEFDLSEDGDGTLFVLTHHFDDRAGAASFATGWEKCLAGLDDVLVGREPGPADRGVERHEELAARFRLDEPQVERTAASWEARFERQLTCPARTAWDLFFGADPETGEQLRAPAVGEEFRPSMAKEVVLGTVTVIEEPDRFEFAVAEGEPGDEVRLWFGDGTGHGARLFLVVTGTDPGELEAAVDQWGAGAIGHVASEAARLETQSG